MIKNQRFMAAMLVLALMFGSLTAVAQTSRGSVLGTVTDSTGAVVPNATVTLVEKSTSTTRQTTTNDAGIYRFDAVNIGIYEIKANASGFSEMLRSNVEIAAARAVTVDIALKVGASSETVSVEGGGAQALQVSEQVRGGSFTSRKIVDLPIAGQNSLNLTLLIPGVVSATTGTGSQGVSASVNGQRARANNFMIDGAENNDISVAGASFTLFNQDAIAEVSIQTSNFSSEFGRAGGAVINQVTKSGTNNLHGTAAWTYLSHVFNATDLNVPVKDKFVENIPAFTIGGPVVVPGMYNGRNKTFFFGAAQWDLYNGQTSTNLRIPTDAGVAVLQPLSAACPNVALYLGILGSLRGDPARSPSSQNIAVPATMAGTTCNGTDRAGQTVQTALFQRQAALLFRDNNHLIRIDHNPSQRQQMSFRWLYDKSTYSPDSLNYPGFDTEQGGRTMSGVFNHTYIFNPRWTNEFRFNYGRIGYNFFGVDATSTMPSYSIAGITGFGVPSNRPQGRTANNFQYQDTVSMVKGKHTVRMGVDFLRQIAAQSPPFNSRGTFGYNSSTTGGSVSSLANFIDDFGGNSGSLNRQFGVARYYPNLFRQTYFVQDSWKIHSDLTLNLGLRYENFGQPANVFTTPAFTNYDSVNFNAPNSVSTDKNNFGPSLGFAWNPKNDSGIMGMLFGGGKSVLRGGYQVSYDQQFNNLLSNIAGSSPNTLGGIIVSLTSSGNPRGLANFQGNFASIVATPPTAQSPQTSLFDPRLRTPYTQRYSLGIQRELPSSMIVDVSYVGSAGRKLYRSIDMNPFVGAARLFPAVGARTIRGTSGNSSYNSLQVDVKRRTTETILGSLNIAGTYTWSAGFDDVTSEFGTLSTASAFQSVSQAAGGDPRIDYGYSDNDRRHVASLNFVLDVKGPKTGILSYVLGGWSLGHVSRFNSAAPFTVRNGSDRNGDGQSFPDRPNFGNPSAPFNSRAWIVSTATCATGLQNPEVGTGVGVGCVTANDVRFVQAVGAPGANTVPRNYGRGKEFIRQDLTIAKSFRITEGTRLQYRAEIFNLFNRVNYGIPALSVGTSSAGTFYNFADTDSNGRNMRMQLKLSF